MGQVLLVHFLVTGLRNYAAVERELRPERTVQVPPISTKKIYRILEIALRKAMILNYLLYSMTCTSRGHARYSLCGPELLSLSSFRLARFVPYIHLLIVQWFLLVSWKNTSVGMDITRGAEVTGSTSRSRPRKPDCKYVVGWGHLFGTRSLVDPWQDVNPQKTQFGYDRASPAPVFVASQLWSLLILLTHLIFNSTLNHETLFESDEARNKVCTSPKTTL